MTKEIIKSVRKALNKEKTTNEIADELEISISCARKVCEKISIGLTDEEISGSKKGRPVATKHNVKSEVRKLIERDPCHTTRSIKEDLSQNGISISASTISRYLKSMDMTRKRLTVVPTERNSDRTIDRRQEFCRRMNNIQDENLVFLDETGFNLHTKKSYGYSLKNTKCFLSVPANRGKNISLMMAINSRGTVAYELKEGAYNGNLFIDFINNKLKVYFQNNPTDVLVMDNCSFHHRHDVVNLLKELNISHDFLPPYTPQLNPIEEYFSCLKARFTTIKPRPKKREEIFSSVSNLIVSQNVCFEGWFRHMRVWVERGIARHEFH